ncbi:hypothetical protein TRIP_C21184 [Candidatus Zixiibacteriota bacterium]|nr:hypothetical protein TRIP_C21184 [candidate division Zixibacteria bacterium]
MKPFSQIQDKQLNADKLEWNNEFYFNNFPGEQKETEGIFGTTKKRLNFPGISA